MPWVINYLHHTCKYTPTRVRRNITHYRLAISVFLATLLWIKTMKPKNFAMITEDKVTKVFCIADDFCKVFWCTDGKIYVYGKKGAHISQWKPHVKGGNHGDNNSLSFIRVSLFETFLSRKGIKHMRHLFPDVLSLLHRFLTISSLRGCGQ